MRKAKRNLELISSYNPIHLIRKDYKDAVANQHRPQALREIRLKYLAIYIALFLITGFILLAYGCSNVTWLNIEMHSGSDRIWQLTGTIMQSRPSLLSNRIPSLTERFSGARVELHRKSSELNRTSGTDASATLQLVKIPDTFSVAQWNQARGFIWLGLMSLGWANYNHIYKTIFFYLRGKSDSIPTLYSIILLILSLLLITPAVMEYNEIIGAYEESFRLFNADMKTEETICVSPAQGGYAFTIVGAFCTLMGLMLTIDYFDPQ